MCNTHLWASLIHHCKKKTNLSVGVNGEKKAARGLVFVFKNTKSLTLDFFLSEVTGLRVKGGEGETLSGFVTKGDC